MLNNFSIAARYAVVGACLWLPENRQKSVERWLRGREEFSKTRKADRILMSYGKSGRTWLRVMMSRFYQTALVLLEHLDESFDSFFAADADAAREMIAALEDEAAKLVKGIVNAHRTIWDEKSPEQRE